MSSAVLIRQYALVTDRVTVYTGYVYSCAAIVKYTYRDTINVIPVEGLDLYFVRSVAFRWPAYLIGII